jgi:hypothetical protein
MSREDSQFKLRLPAALREEIEEHAKVTKRSLNAEIISRLECTSEIDAELVRRTDGSLDYSGIFSWLAYLEDALKEERTENENHRHNPLVIEGGDLAREVATAVATPEAKALVAFLALQAAFPKMVTEKHRRRVAIYAARLMGLDSEDPEEIINSMTSILAGKALSDDLGM